MMHWNVQGQDWIRFDKNNKKIHLLKTFYHVPDFISIFKTFSRSGKLLGKFQYFFKNSGLYTNPEQSSPIKYRYGLMKIT